MEEIEKIQDEKLQMYLKYCLLEAVSKISNIAGVYAAYLKKVSANAEKDIILKSEKACYYKNNTFLNDNVSNIIDKVKCDILYIDPPYNTRQYGSNYHILETIVRNDNPVITGITGLRQTDKSKFCSKRYIYTFLSDISCSKEFLSQVFKILWTILFFSLINISYHRIKLFYNFSN